MRTTTLTKTTLTLAAAAFLAGTSASEAAVINIDINDATPTSYSGASANGPIASGTTWNQLNYFGAPGSLVDDGNNPIGVTVSFSNFGGAFESADTNNLQRDRAYTNNIQVGTVTISGLDSGKTYNLALIAGGVSTTGHLSTDFTISGVGTKTADNSSTAGANANGALTFTDGVTHSLFGNFAPTGTSITFTTQSTTNAANTFGTLAGLQIQEVQAVPEPSTFALFGIGFFGLILRRRR